ncbi:MAG TPA: PA14 domain-containing protein [Chryseosolibacter sp.]
MEKFTQSNRGSTCRYRSLLVLLLALVLQLKGYTQEYDPSIGITNNTGFNTGAEFVQRTINYDKDLGIYKVRMGMDGVGGFNENEPFNWTTRDAVVNKYIAEGFSMHCVVAPRAHTNRNTTWEQWKRNFDYFCRNVMTRYKGKITYYIVDNEPDLGYGNQIGNSITPAEAVEFTRMAYEIARSIDPNIKIESPPTMSPETSYLRSMISLGVTQYCDYLGIHAYGAQIDDGRLSKPWQYMAEFPQFPQRPVAISECGTNPDWRPNGTIGREWQARWFEQFNVALKRYGYDNAILYRADESGAVWDIVFRPAFKAVKNAYRNKTLTNGGFEMPTDLLDPNEWMKIYSADAATPPANILVTSTDKKSGNNSLAINGTGTIRQIVGKLTPGVPVTIHAWVKATNGGTAKLTLQGFDKTNGDGEQTISSTSTAWTQLSATVTPTNPFLVVELESTGGNCFFDEVILNGSPITIAARGVSGAETMELRIDNVPVQSWTLSTGWTTYTYNTSASSANVKVYHINDGPGKDMVVDYVRIGGIVHQAESQAVNTAVWSGTRCGGSRSEWMQCNGYIDFGTREVAVLPLNYRYPENPANAVSGLYYNYYEGSWTSLPNFSTLTSTSSGTIGNFDLTPRLRADNYAFEFNGYVNVPSEGVYTFYTNSDDGSKLYIGEEEIVNNDGVHTATEKSGVVALKAGRHAIKVTYFDQAATEILQVSYSGPGVAKQLIPSAALTRVPLPDFVVTDITWSPANPVPGSKVTFSAVVKNQGQTATPAGMTHGMAFFVDGVKTTCSIGSNASLAVNETRTYTADWCGTTWTAGTNAQYNVSILMDEVNRINESNENNNTFSKIMTMSAAGTTAMQSAQSSISYYPNPAQDEVTVSYESEASMPVQLVVVNGNGEEVLSKNLKAQQGLNTWNVNLRGLKNDIYIVKLRRGDNTILMNRLAIEH